MNKWKHTVVKIWEMIQYHLKVDSDNVKSIVTSSVTKNETNVYVIANRKKVKCYTNSQF